MAGTRHGCRSNCLDWLFFCSQACVIAGRGCGRHDACRRNRETNSSPECNSGSDSDTSRRAHCHRLAGSSATKAESTTTRRNRTKTLAGDVHSAGAGNMDDGHDSDDHGPGKRPLAQAPRNWRPTYRSSAGLQPIPCRSQSQAPRLRRWRPDRASSMKISTQLFPPSNSDERTTSSAARVGD